MCAAALIRDLRAPSKLFQRGPGMASAVSYSLRLGALSD